MKARFIGAGIALAVAAGAACVVDDSPLQLGNFRRMTQECTVVTEWVAGGGSLDVASTSSYLIGIQMSSQTGAVPQPSSEPGTEVINPAPNEIIVDTLEFEYASAGATVGSETQAIHFVVSPGSVDNLLVADLFAGPAGFATIASATSGTTVEVGVRALGKTRSGIAVQTNQAVFPVTVYNSGFPGCAPPSVQARTGPCGNVGGQDGTGVGCCPGGADGGTGDPSCLDQ